jgi:hypothetical protein
VSVLVPRCPDCGESVPLAIDYDRLDCPTCLARFVYGTIPIDDFRTIISRGPPPGWERCQVCGDCPDLVAYSVCSACDNRAEKAGRARSFRYGKDGRSGFIESDGSFTPCGGSVEG